MQQFILKREHITTEFGRVLEYPLTLAVTAMAYGKTTSAKAFLNDSTCRSIWLTVDSDESSPQYILGAFTSQLIKVHPEIGRQLHTAASGLCDG